MIKTLEFIMAYGFKNPHKLYYHGSLRDSENWWVIVRTMRYMQAIARCSNGKVEYFFRVNRSDARLQKCESMKEALDRMIKKEEEALNRKKKA